MGVRNYKPTSNGRRGAQVSDWAELNARQVLTHSKVAFTKSAFDAFQTLAENRHDRKPRKLKGTRKSDAAPAAAAAAPAAKK